MKLSFLFSLIIFSPVLFTICVCLLTETLPCCFSALVFVFSRILPTCHISNRLCLIYFFKFVYTTVSSCYMLELQTLCLINTSDTRLVFHYIHLDYILYCPHVISEEFWKAPIAQRASQTDVYIGVHCQLDSSYYHQGFGLAHFWVCWDTSKSKDFLKEKEPITNLNMGGTTQYVEDSSKKKGGGQKTKSNHQPALSSSDSWEDMVLIVLLELSYPPCLLEWNLYIWMSQYKFVLQQI